MRSDARVAIVGAGFSGTLGAVHLAARGLRVTLIDRRGRFAAGLAYGTREPVHLLNVRAASMSAFPDQPDHLVRWLARRALGDGASFVPRHVYRSYLADVLDGAGGALECRDDQAVAVEPGGVRLASGERIGADAIVLAAGNLPPEPIAALARGPVPYVNDPWSEEGRAALTELAAQDGDLLVLGTGLTMVDTVLSLEARGFVGRTLALSRRGLLPRPHAASVPTAIDAPAARSPSALVRWARDRARTGDWRAVVDSLRPSTSAIWQGWTDDERGRFLRHLRPWWDVHRHRIAPAVADRLSGLIASERLAVRAGRIDGWDGERVAIRFRGEVASEPFAMAGIVNCTGPQGDLRRSGDPLIRDLLDRGLATTDRFGLGFEVDAGLRIGSPERHLYAIGPMTRGAFWEIVAVPDIRGQAQELAGIVAGDLARTPSVRMAAR